MTLAEKLLLIEETLNAESNTLREDTNLHESGLLTSLGVILLVVLLDERFGKSVTADQIKNSATVQDILLLMN